MFFVIFYMGLLAISNAYDNIAVNKPAYQQYTRVPGDGRYDASNAVDGRKSDLRWNGGQCAVSGPSSTAMWWVNLTSIRSIHHITIYFATDNVDSRFRAYMAQDVLGFSVYVSNTTDKSQGTLCFKDDNFSINTIPPVFTTNCFIHGQYVIYYNERLPGVVYPDDYYGYVWIVLCEVEVYGCQETGFYGSNCSIPCPDVNCQYCHIETGYSQCCKPGYQGHQCELACNKEFYGVACNEECGHCREVNQCHHINGTCLTGCAAGYHGNMCKTACSRGFFGEDCSKKCIDTCAGCNNINGLCDYGCIPGSKGYFCIEECDKGSYGIECNGTCGHCRDINQCSNVNGTCLTGCDAGYEGDLCKTHCVKGSYGIGCNETCGHCSDLSQCSKVNGSCLTGCDAGYKGDFCKSPVCLPVQMSKADGNSKVAMKFPQKTDSWAHRKENILMAIYPSSAFSKDISRNN
ncbi:uncharacterized protein [Magallana gigas]|uniref:uncharacterized protein n=1 Tax=Magallana gigas TaxID=29159 RepID=UPI00333F9AD6